MTSVLLVEDSATIRHLLTEAIRARGLQVEVVADGADVLAIARELQPAVIVINKMLPGGDGYGLLTAMRQDRALDGARVMMLTESKRREDVLASIQRGVDDYVVKPFDPGDVASRVARLAAR